MEEEEIDFKAEAEAVIDDIGFTVQSISVSKKMPPSRERVYMNILTKEDKIMCVELSVQGFRVVGHQFDDHQPGYESRYYETIYALLDSTSPGYTASFGEALVKKLSTLQGSSPAEKNVSVELQSSNDDSSCSP